MRIIVLILSVVFQLTAGAVGLFILLLGLNGYSEKQATPSLILFITLVLASALGLGVCSPFAARGLAKRTSLGSFGTSAIVVTAFCIIGVLIIFAGLFTSFALAEVLRANR